MSEATIDETDIDDVIEDEVVSEYTTETPIARPVVTREIVTAPGAATGRRKQAIARVRLVPGTGQWTINGRDLEGYFPNKVHQQEVNEPFVALGAEGSSTSSPASTAAASPARPARCAWASPAP